MDELTSSGKLFEISKWEVWEAYRKVKANRGARRAWMRSLSGISRKI